MRPTTAIGLKWGAPSPNMIPIAGTKITSGTTGCTRERRSRKSESNIRGEARRTSARWASIAPNLADRAPVSRLPEPGPGGPQELEAEGGPEPEDDDLVQAAPLAGGAGEHERQEV